MRWEEMTTEDLKKAAATHGVCILPLGIHEKHGNHLPLGTDMYIVRSVACRAAEIEPAVVFPYYYYSQGSECQHYTGCIKASHELIISSLQEMCDEIARNGFKKILIMSGHGGNWGLVGFFAHKILGTDRDYTLYMNTVFEVTKEREKRIIDFANGVEMGDHAGFSETALMMHIRPDLVHLDRQDPNEGQPLGRTQHLRDLNIFSGLNWYGFFPGHIGGDFSAATPEMGKLIFDVYVENACEVISKIKSDTVLPELFKEFNEFARCPK